MGQGTDKNGFSINNSCTRDVQIILNGFNHFVSTCYKAFKLILTVIAFTSAKPRFQSRAQGFLSGVEGGEERRVGEGREGE